MHRFQERCGKETSLYSTLKRTSSIMKFSYGKSGVRRISLSLYSVDRTRNPVLVLWENIYCSVCENAHERSAMMSTKKLCNHNAYNMFLHEKKAEVRLHQLLQMRGPLVQKCTRWEIAERGQQHIILRYVIYSS